MFHCDSQLPHLLPPAAYSSPEFFNQERREVFGDAWHFVCLIEDLARPGDYFSGEVLGIPIVCRNVDGEIRAFKNVCLHRHSRIAAPGRGSGQTLRCQYHGWEYGDEGQVAKITDGKSFKGIRPKDWCLARYRVDTLGSLVFVNIGSGAKGLRDSVGELGEELDHFFGDHSVVWRSVTEYPVNWKIIVENAVESYHVPMLHPGTFKDYRKEEFHDHRLEPAYTSYLDTAPMERSLVELGLGTLTSMLAPTVRFARAKHVNIFPNHLFYALELYSIFSTAEPLGPERTRFTSIGLLPRHIRRPLMNRPIQHLFRLALIRMMRRIMREDMGIWSEVQSGIRHSANPGVLSCREERVYAFQRYISEALATHS
jgi:phenylpropionate dioxygenase-like ring-hydroxylating dioxygenase large terminal subunit